MSISVESICSKYEPKGIDPLKAQEKIKEFQVLNDLLGFVGLLEKLEHTKARMKKWGSELSEEGIEIYGKYLQAAQDDESAIKNMVFVLQAVNASSELSKEDRDIIESMLFDANELSRYFEELEISEESRALYLKLEASTPEKSLTLKAEKALKQIVGVLAQSLPAAYRKWLGVDDQWVDGMVEKENYSAVKTRLGSLFKTECQKLIKKEPIAAPPGKEPDGGQAGAKKPEPKTELFQYRLMLKPVYGLTLPDKEHSLGLQGAAGAQFNFSEKLNLQLDYKGDLFVPSDFSSAKQGRDSATVLLGVRPDHEKVDSVNPQLNFLRDKNYQLGTEEWLGGAGVGLSLLGGRLHPFAGGLFGTSFGGYAGIDVVLNGEHNISLFADYSTGWGLESALGYAYTAAKWAVGAQAFYANDLDATQKVGGTLAGRYTLAHFLKNDLSLQPSVTVAQTLSEDSMTDLIFGLSLVFGQAGEARPLTLKPFLYDLPNGGSSE